MFVGVFRIDLDMHPHHACFVGHAAKGRHRRDSIGIAKTTSKARHSHDEGPRQSTRPHELGPHRALGEFDPSVLHSEDLTRLRSLMKGLRRRHGGSDEREAEEVCVNDYR